MVLESMADISDMSHGGGHNILCLIPARILEDSRIESWTHLHKHNETVYQCERQRKAEKLFQMEREQRSMTSNCKM